MIKTITVKKQLNLHELIKHVWDNRLSNVFYDSTPGDFTVSFDTFGRIYGANGSLSHIEMHHEFAVEVENEIDERTQFKNIVGVLSNGSVIANNDHYNINQLRVVHPNIKQIYAVIDNNLELIWEVEENE